MSWLSKIQNKSHPQKLRIMWTVCGVTAAILVALWVITSRFEHNIPRDTSLFKVLGRGIKDLQENYRK